ncbi:MAG TPA: methionyl-tRNA formyltransferase [Candidatus Saccharimonadales bacterium]|nr:methionyl-tRNA formyltransferase [Candidatus Saccharimonadales bacterium]
MANERLIFFGNERLATGVTTTAPVLRALVAAGYQVAAVVVSQGDPAQSRKARLLEIETVAGRLGIPVIAPTKTADIKDKLEAWDAQAGILVAYGKLVPKEIIDVFPRGIINIHPSLLPKRRGSTPIENTILYDEKETGVSLMRLVEEMDAGPTYVQQKIQVPDHATKQQLADSLLNLGKDMLIEHLPTILSGSLKPEPQDDLDATYDKQIKKDAGDLDTSKPATDLEREIRAYAGWPRNRIMLGTTEVIVTKAHVAPGVGGLEGTLWLQDKQLGVHCAEDTLVIDALIPPGKREMTAEAFLAGYSLA